jgi:TetR/AcrR family transcriptional regulator
MVTLVCNIMPKKTFFNLPDEKRRALVDVLLDEFAGNDYRNVSIARIVHRAGIAKGSFYQYFADKQDCYLYLIQLAMDEKKAFLSQSPPPEEASNPFARLRWLLAAGTRFEFSSPRLARIAYRAVFDDVPLPEQTLALIRRGGLDYFHQLFEQGIQAGEVRPDADPRVAAFLYNVIFTNLGQHLMERFGIPPARLLEDGGRVFDHEEAHRAIDQVLNVLERGLRSEPQPKERS